MKRDAEFFLTAPAIPIGNQLATLSLTLKNCSDRALYFCARFAFVPIVGDVWPTLTAPSGSQVPFTSRVRLARLRATDFILLKPGQAVLAGVHLARHFKLEHPGRYTLSAKYVSREVPAELAQEAVFLGEIESEVIEFTVDNPEPTHDYPTA